LRNCQRVARGALEIAQTRRYGPPRNSEGFMATSVVPHFHNDAGIPVIEIGAHEFKCVGAKPPHDHPHVYLDMGSDHEIICPYCSTLYRYNPKLNADEAKPAECAYRAPAAV
jgi:uncharacterized Zn-finger protein